MHGCDVILQAVILADPKGLNMVLYLAWGRWSNEELTFIKRSWCDGGCCAVQASARGVPESADVALLVSLCARLSSSAVDWEAK